MWRPVPLPGTVHATVHGIVPSTAQENLMQCTVHQYTPPSTPSFPSTVLETVKLAAVLERAWESLETVPGNVGDTC